MIAMQTIRFRPHRFEPWWLPTWLENILYVVAVGLMFTALAWALGAEIVRRWKKRRPEPRGFDVLMR